MTERRRFNGAERSALRLLADGRCAACGTRLDATWHADHATPFSRGGATDVLNGRALCAPCNLSKGNRVRNVNGDWPDGRDLRAWQADAVAEYRRLDAADFLLVATPGAGKTTAALRIAHGLLADGVVERVTVVVPTDHLRKQWTRDAAAVGIELDPEWANTLGDAETGDYHGIVVTYQTVAANPLLQRALCRRATLVILDEVHHAGDNLTWGKQFRLAFDAATRRLLLSGTPFRGDDNTIPFVRYDNGRSVSHTSYGYGRAIADAVCRIVTFPRYDARTAWTQRDGARESESLREELPDDEAARRLRTALDIRGGWLRDVIREAHAQLMEVRAAGHPRAGGLIVCIDQAHAKGIAAVVREVTGREPVVAISEDADASRKIEAFRAGAQPWLVAVRLVSEGVDIPRLCVGVYATNVITLLFFRQLLGRLLRMEAGDHEQAAYLFIPAEPMLERFAETIEVEQAHAIRELVRSPDEGPDPEAGCGCTGTAETFFHAGASEALADGVIHNGSGIPRAEYDRAAAFAGAVDLRGPQNIAKLAQALRLAGLHAAPAGAASVRPAAPRAAVADRKKQVLNARKLAVATLGRLMQVYAEVAGDAVYGHINGRLKRLAGDEPKKLTLAQLQRQVAVLGGWTEGLRLAVAGGAGRVWLEEWERGEMDAAVPRAE